MKALLSVQLRSMVYIVTDTLIHDTVMAMLCLSLTLLNFKGRKLHYKQYVVISHEI